MYYVMGYENDDDDDDGSGRGYMLIWVEEFVLDIF